MWSLLRPRSWPPLAPRTSLPLDLAVERREVRPGLVRALRFLPGALLPVQARPLPSPWLAISDEPEQAGPEMGASCCLSRWIIPLEGRTRVRLLIYHVNGKGSPARSFATWVEGARVVEARGWDWGRSFRGSSFSLAAGGCLEGSLPLLPPGPKGAVFYRKGVPGTGDPSSSFFGGLAEVELEGHGHAELITACSTHSPFLVKEDPWVLPPNCPPGPDHPDGQDDLIGHPRGLWPFSAVTGPLPEGEELVATGRSSDWTQFVLGQGLFPPCGGDVELFRGSSSPPVTRANRGLYGVDQRLVLPLRGAPPGGRVRGWLISLAHGQDQRGVKDSKLFGAIQAGGKVWAVERSREAHLASEAVQLCDLAVSPGELRREEASFHMGAASSGPVGLFLQGVRPGPPGPQGPESEEAAASE